MNNIKGKVILLGGCPRAGKTTLSVKLVRSGLGFSKISMDYIGEAFGNTDVDKFEFAKTLLEKLLHDAQAYGIHSIFDYYPDEFTLDDIQKLPFKDELDMYFLGFPDISVEAIRYNIKHYAKPIDWIYHVDDDYIAVVAQRIYDFNIKLKADCEKYGYKYINTGVGGERPVILNSLYDEIIEKVGR